MTTATTTTDGKKTRAGKEKFPKVSELDKLVLFLRENNVKRFKYQDLEIEIDTLVNAARNEQPADLDEKAAKMSAQFKQTPEDDLRDQFWST